MGSNGPNDLELTPQGPEVSQNNTNPNTNTGTRKSLRDGGRRYLDPNKGINAIKSNLNADGTGKYTQPFEPPFKHKESRLLANINEEQFWKEVNQNSTSQALGFFTGSEYDLAATICMSGAFQAYENEIRSATFFKPCRTPSYWSYENLTKVVRSVELVHMIMDQLLDYTALSQCGTTVGKLKGIISTMDSYCNSFLIETYPLHITQNSKPLEILQVFTKYFTKSQNDIMKDFNEEEQFIMNFYCAFYIKICKILYKFNAYYLNKKIKGSFGNIDFNRVFSGIKGASKGKEAEELGVYSTADGLQEISQPRVSKLSQSKVAETTTNNAKKYAYLAMQALDVFLPIKLIPDCVMIYDGIVHLVLSRTYVEAFDDLRKMCRCIRISFISMFSKTIIVEANSNNGIFNKIVFKPVKEKNIKTINNTTVEKGYVYKFFKSKMKRNYISQLVARDLTGFINLFVMKSQKEGGRAYVPMNSSGIVADHDEDVLEILNNTLKDLKLTKQDLK